MDITKLGTKEKLLILKAVSENAINVYKDNNEFVLNQVMKRIDKKINTKFGTFYKELRKAKTIEELLLDKYEKLAELQKDIETLESYTDKTQKLDDDKIILKSMYNDLANDIAIDLLTDLLEGLESKRINKSKNKIAASKNARIAK